MMKIAVLCLCLFAFALAAPVGKHHDDSLSSEGYHAARHPHKHHARGYHHRHFHSQEHLNSHESQEHPASSQLGPLSSEESDEITEQQTLLVPQSKSKEDDDSHSDIDDEEDRHDDESDESDENGVTGVPTEPPFSMPVTPEIFTGRGDVPYGMKANVDLMHFKKSRKGHRRHGKFDSHDVSEDMDSMPEDVDIREFHSAKSHSLESHGASLESNDESHEVHDKSAEYSSRQKPESAEEYHDGRYHDGSHVSTESRDSREFRKGVNEVLQEIHPEQDADSFSDQSFESAEDRHSAEAQHHHSAEAQHHSAEEHHLSAEERHLSAEERHHSAEQRHHSAEERRHSAEDRYHSMEDNEVTL